MRLFPDFGDASPKCHGAVGMDHGYFKRKHSEPKRLTKEEPLVSLKAGNDVTCYFLFSARSMATAMATVAPTMGLLPMPRKPIIST